VDDDAYDVQSVHSPFPQLKFSSLIKTATATATATTLMKEASHFKNPCIFLKYKLRPVNAFKVSNL